MLYKCWIYIQRERARWGGAGEEKERKKGDTEREGEKKIMYMIYKFLAKGERISASGKYFPAKCKHKILKSSIALIPEFHIHTHTLVHVFVCVVFRPRPCMPLDSYVFFRVSQIDLVVRSGMIT